MRFTLKQQTVFEITIVLGVMLLVKDVSDRLALIGAGSIAMWCGIIVATLFMRKHNITWRQRGLALPENKRAWLKAFGYALVIIVASLVFMGGILPLITNALGLTIPESSTDRFEFFLGNVWLFLAYLVVVIWLGAALGEELLMRGFLLNSLLTLFGDNKAGIAAAITVHALIFGLLHISQGIPGIIGTGVVAVILGSVYLYTKRQLFPLILAHGLINSISLTAYFVTDGKLT
ncbi:CPBP family intramembrane metalloprotease [Aestuariibacter halophilus]|uniref:CPBP family intramembrane metalloprotease n=1 Tax=Fluctibacter halophilus TaxID=226011 RepID=A0ABS8G6I2_9ALTE|nr:CPBP family intramembrane glutamic endopeptidase [Aestuariibacter halophilus]MCC2616160.1 CPBP family intramembrane metalloprotease [Aestuariibacter halophilus]